MAGIPRAASCGGMAQMTCPEKNALAKYSSCLRIFKTKWFAHYARRERIGVDSLREAIERTFIFQKSMPGKYIAIQLPP
jgi:hypothetical protein